VTVQVESIGAGSELRKGYIYIYIYIWLSAAAAAAAAWSDFQCDGGTLQWGGR
jgi:hypothetical protein